MVEVAEAGPRSPRQAIAVASGMAVAAVTAYRLLRPARSANPGDNYFDIIGNLDSCVRAAAPEGIQYIMMGGGASHALSDPRTRILGRDIIPPSGIEKPQYRPSGTMADVDILVISRDPLVVR